jgi:hypothetical protein
MTNFAVTDNQRKDTEQCLFHSESVPPGVLRMNPLRFTFSVKAQVCSAAIDIHTLGLLRGESMEFGLPPNGSSFTSEQISRPLVSHRPRSGLRFVSTRVKLSNGSSDLRRR